MMWRKKTEEMEFLIKETIKRRWKNKEGKNDKFLKIRKKKKEEKVT